MIAFAQTVLIALNAAFAAPGDWPEPRHNPQLTAIQPVSGTMKDAPTPAGRIDLGRTPPAITSVNFGEGSASGLFIVAGKLRCIDTNGNLRWESHPAGLNYESIVAHEDLDGDGKAEVLLQAGRPTQPFGAAVLVSLDDGAVLWQYDVEPMSYAWYLFADSYWPNDTKKQIVVLMHAYPPDKDNGYITLFAFEGAASPVQKWRYAFEEYTCFPSLLRNDIDSDGVQEIVVQTHSRMWHLDAVTGVKKNHIHWDVSPGNERSYGLVKFTDVNKDGRNDFLCIATFAQHHEVLLNKEGAFEKAWGYGWAESVTTGKVATTHPNEPDVDIDGDGAMEIVLSMYNSENESAWLTRIYDAVTGTLKYRVPGAIAVGTGDLNGDGATDLLVNLSSDPSKSKTDGVKLFSFQGGTQSVLWEDATFTALPTNKQGELRVSKGEERFKLLIDPADTITLEPWTKPARENKATFVNIPALVGPGMPDLLAVDVNMDGRNELIAYQEPHVRAQSWNGTAFDLIAEATSSAMPVFADFDADGALDIATCEVKPGQTPVVEVKTPSQSNRSVWRSSLPPTDRAGLPHPRLAYLRSAHFTGNPNPDLYLYAGTPVVRSVGIDGRTGNVLWEKGESPGIERYWAPTVNLASTFDFDSDGKSDLVFTNPDYYCVASAINGEPLLGPLFPPKIFNQPSQGLYTMPVILDRVDLGPMVALIGGHYFQAAMSVRAEPLW
ncbi:MAG TPA: VCBS repeat-containing protein, partial [Candidatus Hydrogenedentes bacterium]|nr:VCBS repeat-containing protein [Candidatus Hydrogenedentota bacterium]